MSTPAEPAPPATIEAAAAWLLTTPRSERTAAVPALWGRFGLTPSEAVAAIRLKDRIRNIPGETREVSGRNPGKW